MGIIGHSLLSDGLNTRYPLADDCAMETSDGLLFPDGILAEAVLIDTTTTAEDDESTAFLFEGIDYSPSGLALVFSYGAVVVKVPMASGNPYERTVVTDNDGRIILKCVYSGTWRAVLNDAGFSIPRALLKTPAKVLPTHVIRISYGLGLKHIKRGDAQIHGRVHLRPGYNATATIQAGGINVLVGRGLGLGQKCDGGVDSEKACSSFLLYINGQTAGDNGNINLTGGSGVSIGSAETKTTYMGKQRPTIEVTATPALTERFG